MELAAPPDPTNLPTTKNHATTQSQGFVCQYADVARIATRSDGHTAQPTQASQPKGTGTTNSIVRRGNIAMPIKNHQPCTSQKFTCSPFFLFHDADRNRQQ